MDDDICFAYLTKLPVTNVAGRACNDGSFPSLQKNEQKCLLTWSTALEHYSISVWITNEKVCKYIYTHTYTYIAISISIIHIYVYIEDPSLNDKPPAGASWVFLFFILIYIYGTYCLRLAPRWTIKKFAKRQMIHLSSTRLPWLRGRKK